MTKVTLRQEGALHGWCVHIKDAKIQVYVGRLQKFILISNIFHGTVTHNLCDV